MVKIGDKVRFLNAVGGGIVRQITKDIAMVEEDDGFETPVLLHECVVIEPVSEQKSSGKEKQPHIVPVEIVPEKKEEIPVLEISGGDRLNLSLAFVPDDIKKLSETPFNCYLINDSNYYVFFSYAVREKELWKIHYAGLIEPNLKLYVETFGHEHLNDMERVCVQYVAFKKNKGYALKNPASVELRIDTVKFYKLHSFKINDYFDEGAIVYPIVHNDVPEQSVRIPAAELEQAMRSKIGQDKATHKPQAVPETKTNAAEILEIDLHIDELLDSTAGMDSADILKYQLDTFRKVLEENKRNKGKKIVFIHGKGEGVLRKAILNELNTKYRNFYHQDASFREYGFGATMVTIR